MLLVGRKRFNMLKLRPLMGYFEVRLRRDNGRAASWMALMIMHYAAIRPRMLLREQLDNLLLPDRLQYMLRMMRQDNETRWRRYAVSMDRVLVQRSGGIVIRSARGALTFNFNLAASDTRGALVEQLGPDLGIELLNRVSVLDYDFTNPTSMIHWYSGRVHHE